MKYYFYRLHSPRPTFPADMTAEEGDMMRRHVAYWTDVMVQGKVVAFGPVADPAGSFGVGIIRLEDDADPVPLGLNDPAVQADMGFRFEFHPMPRVVLPEGTTL